MTSYTVISKILRSAIFNPKTDTNMQIPASMCNSDYFECSALEMISRATKCRKSGSYKLYEAHMYRALQLIALGIANEATEN